jgi:hypothetical protein
MDEDARKHYKLWDSRRFYLNKQLLGIKPVKSCAHCTAHSLPEDGFFAVIEDGDDEEEQLGKDKGP